MKKTRGPSPFHGRKNEKKKTGAPKQPRNGNQGSIGGGLAERKVAPNREKENSNSRRQEKGELWQEKGKKIT